MQLLTPDEISQLPELSVGDGLWQFKLIAVLCPAAVLAQAGLILQMSYWRTTAKRQSSGRPPCTKEFARRENAGKPNSSMAVGTSMLAIMTLRKRQPAPMTRRCWS